jgi:RNA polymerase sigma factor (sigma-70 family)
MTVTAPRRDRKSAPKKAVAGKKAAAVKAPAAKKAVAGKKAAAVKAPAAKKVAAKKIAPKKAAAGKPVKATRVAGDTTKGAAPTAGVTPVKVTHAKKTAARPVKPVVSPAPKSKRAAKTPPSVTPNGTEEITRALPFAPKAVDAITTSMSAQNRPKKRMTGGPGRYNASNRNANAARDGDDEIDNTPTDFNGRNAELFARRQAVKSELDRLGDNPRGSRQRVQVRRLKSELNDIDTAIIELNYGLVLDYVKKFTSTTSREDSRDFEGAAVLGLMRAISSYDPTRGSKFSTWAYKPIQRECLRAVRDADFKHLNPGDFEKRPEILRAVRTLTKEDALPVDQPSYEEIARESGATLETVRRVLTAQEQQSLYKPVGDGEDSFLVDLIRDPDGEIEDMVLARQEVHDLELYGLSSLDERELFVIGRRFGLDAEPPQRLSTIGNILGLSREAVRQVESKALSKLNHPLVLRRMVLMGRK